MLEVAVTVIDPWSFVDEHGANLTATVLERDGEFLLIRLAGGLYVASPGSPPSYSLIPTTEDRLQDSSLWGRDLWRGQPTALLANLQL
jgi:hypothetical protein